MKRRSLTVPMAIVMGLTWIGAVAAAVPITRVIVDPYTNTTSPHETAVEPDTFAYGSTIVVTSQVGRFFNGGGAGIGFATSTDAGATWTSGILPGLTSQPPIGGGPYERSTDPAVAYDAAHDTWLIQSLPLPASVIGVAIAVNRSTDGGHAWGNPILSAVAGAGQDFDKNWIVCDNHAASPFYGRCYQTWDDFGDGDRLLMNYSTDGGLTWSAPAMTADRAKGLGGQPVVQPNGTVIVPSANANEGKIIAFRSTDGGVTWGKSVVIARAVDHNVAGNLRSSPLPSAEIDAAGNVYVVWQSCRFRKGCKANDIVMSTSTDGLTWGAVTRIPIDPLDSGVDHFIPGIGVDPATSGATARLGLTYYFYSNAGCGKATTCELEVGYVQSNDGGGSWSSAVQLVAPFPIDWNPLTSQGYMVGDYISTSWVGGRAFGAFAVALAPSGSVLDQAIYVPTAGLFASAATIAADRPTVVATSDHLGMAPVRTR